MKADIHTDKKSFGKKSFVQKTEEGIRPKYF